MVFRHTLRQWPAHGRSAFDADGRAQPLEYAADAVVTRHSQVCEGASGALANPETNGSTVPTAQCIDNQTRLALIVHENTYRRSLDHDANVKPLVAVGVGHDGFLVFAGVLGSQPLPRPIGMRHVFHRVAVARRVGRSKVERAEVHRIVCSRIDHVKSDADKASLNRLATAQHVEVDGAIRKIVPAEPHDTDSCAFIELERMAALDIDDRCRSSHDRPAGIPAHGGYVQIFR